MSPARLLEHFDRLIDTPDAVPRLRRFILDLAVRGKLVEQDPKDEPAGELLTRITKEKVRLIKDGSLRQQVAQTLAQEYVPFDLPAGWRWTQLAEIGVVNPRCHADDSVAASFVPMPKIPAKYGQPHEHEVRQWGEIKKGFTQFAEGDVGLAKITPCFENGKSTVFRELTGGLGAGTTELHVLRPVFVSANYILVFLKSSHFIATGIPKMTGTAGQKRVSREYFAFSPVPLPPLAEQHRIVAKVDELMALCNELEAAQTKCEKRRDRLVAATLHGLNNGDGTPTPGGTPSTFEESARFYFNHLPRLTTRPEHIHQLRQTILNLAVRGKLVPQDPKDQPASQLIEEMRKEKRTLIGQGSIKKGKPLQELGNLAPFFDLPKGWSWVRLGELAKMVTSGSRDWAQHYSAQGAIFVRMGNLSRGSYQLRLNHIQRVKPPDDTEGARTKLEEGDLLVSITGEAGLLGLIPANFGEAYINQHTCLVRPMPQLKNRYLPELFRSPFAQDQFNEPQRGIKNSLRLTDVTEFLVPLPPLAEQHRIVAKVDELMALCNKFEAGLVSAITTGGLLFEASLSEALRIIPAMTS